MGDRSKVLVARMQHGTWLSAFQPEADAPPAQSHQLSAKSVLRIILGNLFIVSGLAKMWDIYGFSNNVSSYGVLPTSLVVPVSIIVPFAEFVLGIMLLINFHPSIASLSLLAMVVVFTGLSAMKYFSGSASDCGCFGKLGEREITSSFFIINATLIIALFTLTGSATLTK